MNCSVRLWRIGCNWGLCCLWLPLYADTFNNKTFFYDVQVKDTIQKVEEEEEVVVVAAKKRSKLNQSLMGAETLNVEEINKLPVFFGERDIIKIIELLPGVKRNSNGISVRGGSSDQNLVLLDDATLYNPDHFLGLFSTFNSDALKEVTLYKGTAPAPYGGRVASLFDIHMREGDRQCYRVSGGIGLIASRLSVEGPLQKGKSSFLLSGRRTYADVFLLLSPEFRSNRLYFYDLNGKLNYKFSEKDQIFLSGYFGRDVLKLSDIVGIEWGNATGTLRYRHTFRPNLLSNTTFVFSQYNFNVLIQPEIADLEIKSLIQDFNIKQEWQYMPQSAHDIKIGLNIILHTNNPGQVISPVFKRPGTLRRGVESALYVDHQWSAHPRLKVHYGFRLSNFLVLGGSEYYELDADKELIKTFYPQGILRQYLNVEPRLSLNYKALPTVSLKFAYTRNTQHLHLITNSVASSPTDRWIMNSNNIQPEIADQVSAGYVQSFKEGLFELTVEAYYKWLHNQLDYKEGGDDRTPYVETQLLSGTGRAYGVEFLLKKNKGKFTGWLSYTIARSEKKINDINNYEWYLARQDRPHDVTLVLMYAFSKKINVSVIGTYKTGDAVTIPSGHYNLDGRSMFAYTKRNGYRMPPTHHVDIALNYTIVKTKKFTSELSFNIYNVYARQNPYIIRFMQRNSGVLSAEQVALGSVIPSVLWNFKF